jgi:hypothetical protein|tara:strand:+ start:6829 stop:7110 length:282 start_codon:yes stop_codon:yes gene_type:complete
MSIVKVTAMLSGLLGWANAHEWVVTTKLGRFIAKEVEAVKGGAVGKVTEKGTYVRLSQIRSLHVFRLSARNYSGHMARKTDPFLYENQKWCAN